MLDVNPVCCNQDNGDLLSIFNEAGLMRWKMCVSVQMVHFTY